MWLFYYNNTYILFVIKKFNCLVVIILFVRGCIIEADKTDYQDDVLSKADIKKINLNLENVKFDINHSKEPIEGCKLVENSIVDYPITLGESVVNEGSWIVTISVDNPELEALIATNEVMGFSLFSYSNDATTYSDVRDKEDVYPIFISFVPNPSNQLHFEVLSELNYICKSESGNMADSENGFIEKLKELISSYDGGSNGKSDDEEGTKPTDTNKESGAVSKAGGEPVDKTDKADSSKDTSKDDKTGEVSKDCTDDKEDGAVQKDAGTVPPGMNMENQGGDGLSELNGKMDKLINMMQQLIPSNEEANPQNTDANKNYIVKSETVKNDKPSAPVKEESVHFDLFGRKL